MFNAPSLIWDAFELSEKWIQIMHLFKKCHCLKMICCGGADFYVSVLSSVLMLYITKANEPMIAAIETNSISPNIFSPFYFILRYLSSKI